MSAPRTTRRSTLYDLPQYNRDVELQYYQYTNLFETQHPFWWNIKLIVNCFKGLIENTFWNSSICILVLMAVTLNTINIREKWFFVTYNITYAIHMLAIGYDAYANRAIHAITWRKVLGLLIDLLSFTHYLYPKRAYKFICYYIRLHRPFKYLWTLTNYNLKGSILGTTLKYCYILMVVRITWAILWLLVDELEQKYSESPSRRNMKLVKQTGIFNLGRNSPTVFLSALYIVNKMFIPIGPSVAPDNDMERLACMMVMVSGCLLVTGAAVASMSLVISLYMRPEETFRARFQLIMEQMKDSRVPVSQRDKVETFYKMYWHKQKAVSSTQLLPTFPPTLSATIQCDIYFEATQKSRVLQDLSYEFLSEVAKKMQTRRFIPGDAIIKRLSNKCSLIYITYGDIEMVTAEDDATAILRMSRGTILTPTGACAPAGFGQAHVEVRAATFCLAHVLEAKELWKVAIKYGKDTDQSNIIYEAFVTHMEMVLRHYRTKAHEAVKHKSSILHFKRCLMALKEARDANGDLLLARTDVFLEIAGCYIMRNRADSSLTDESDAICLRPTFPCILQPNSSLTLAWNLVVASLILTVCFVHPYYLVYKKIVPLGFRFFDYVMSAIFLIDLVVELSTGANVEEGVPITFTQTSSQQMRSHWFVLDLLATLPIFEFIGSGHFAGINKLLRLHKVFRVLKSLEDMTVYRSNVLRFLSYTLLLIIACYLIASLQQGFMCYHFGYCLVKNFTHSPYWEKEPLDEETVEHRVTFGLYWAISMIMFTSHMETWGNLNWYNVLYTMFVLEVCVVLRIFMEAVYSATIMVTTSLREDYDATISMVKSFLIKNEVDPVLRQRFITYLQLCWYTDKAYAMTNKRSIFFDLPSHVYQDIVARQRVKYLLTIPFMKFFNKEDLKIVSSSARLFYTSPNEILINTGDICNEMYVIAQGICEIINPITEEQVALLHEKCHFGVFVCLFRVPAHYTIRALTHVQIFSVTLKSVSRPFQQYPFLNNILEDIRNHPGFGGICTPRTPFISYLPPGLTPNTEKFELPRKHEVDYDFLHPFNKLGFLSVLRYIFPRFTIRPDGPYLIRYEWFRALCTLAVGMAYPSYCYLVIGWPQLWHFTYCLDFCAYGDVIQRMLVGYYTPEGILVYHPAATAAHYAKGPMIVDLIACVPWEHLQGYRKLGNKFRVTRTEQFLMFNRLLQMYRLQSIMQMLDEYFERKDLIMVVRAIPVFIVMVNVMTSFIVLYSTRIYHTVDYSEFDIKPYEDKGGNWLHLFSKQFRFNMTDSVWNLHLTTYFWVLYETTTTGYNCFNPSNFTIMRLLFAGMLTGAMIITYFSVRIISLRANVNKALAEFQEHMKDMLIWMQREKLDENLQRDVFEHYEYTWDKMGGVDYNSVFKLCDQITLRTDAILHVYGSIFSKCPILSSAEVSLLRLIGRASHSLYFLRGTAVIECDDVMSDIYFVDYGGIQSRYIREGASVIDTLLRGSLFGNLGGEPTIRCPVGFTATSRVHLLRINSKAFHKILDEFPDVLENMKKTMIETNKPYYIKGGQVTDDLSTWKERSLSAPVVVRSTTRRNIIKYFYFKDNMVQTYLILVSLMSIFMDIYNAGFQDNRLGVMIGLYALDLAFYVKMVLYLLMPIFLGGTKAKEMLLLKRKKYIKGDLRYDVFSCLPLELFCFVDEDNQWMIFSWLRLNRIFRIVTVYSSLKRYRERITVNLGLMTIWAVTIWFSLSVHTISCIWYYLGTVNDKYQPKSSWIYKDDKSSWCDNTYICSLYFVLTTFTQNGVGDIMPKVQSEVVFVCILLVISTMVCMVYVGEFSNIIQYKSFRSFSFYSKYLELQEFLKNNRVSRNLVKQVNRYSLHLWRESRGVQSPYFLLNAPQALRLTVMSDAYMRHIRLHFIFKDCEPAFLRQLVGCFQMYTYDEDMFVVKACEITDSMYFIHRGKVTDISEDPDFPSTIYTVGTSFGLEQGLKHNVPFVESFRTLTKSQVLTLYLDDWLLLLKHFPVSAAAIAAHGWNVGPDGRGGGGGGGTSGAGGPRGHGGSFASEAMRRKPRITELIDRGSQPTPPSTTSSFIRVAAPAGHPDHPESKGASRVARFVPPAGPQRDELDPIDDTGRWPTNIHRRGTMYPKAGKEPSEIELVESNSDAATLPVAEISRWSTETDAEMEAADKQTTETEPAETKLEVAEISRWLTETDAEMEAADKETTETESAETKLDAATSPVTGISRLSTDSRRRDTEEETAEKETIEKMTAKTEASETKLDAATSPVAGISRLSTDSRRRDTEEKTAEKKTTETKTTEKETAEMETAETEPAKTMLDAATSPVTGTSRWPIDGRHRKTDEATAKPRAWPIDGRHRKTEDKTAKKEIAKPQAWPIDGRHRKTEEETAKKETAKPRAWPIDGRRRKTEEETVKKETAMKETAKEETAEKQTTEPAETKLDAATSPVAETSLWPDSRRRDTEEETAKKETAKEETAKKETAESEPAETELDAATSPVAEISRWPDSRRRDTEEETAKKETAKEETAKKETAESEPAETELNAATSPVAEISRWSTETDAEMEAADKETTKTEPAKTKLEVAEISRWLTETDAEMEAADKETTETEPAETKLDAATSPVTGISRLSTDSRRRKTKDETAMEETAKVETAEKKTVDSKSAETHLDAATSLSDETSLWPDSRRRDTEEETDKKETAKKETAERETAEKETTESEPAETELDVATSLVAETSRWPSDSRRRDIEEETAKEKTAEKETADSEPAETNLDAATLPVAETSRWPSDSHHRGTEEENAKMETAKEETAEEETSKKETAKEETAKEETAEKETAEPEPAETELDAANLPVAKTSHWPSDSRRRNTEEETAKKETAKEETAKEETAKDETAKEETAEPEPAQTKLDAATSPASGISRWPTDSRRRETEEETAKKETDKEETAETKPAESKLKTTTSPDAAPSRWPINSRRETVMFDRPFYSPSEESIKKETAKKKTSKKETAEKELAQTNLDTTSSFGETSRWPINSRRETLFNDRPFYSSTEDVTAETELAQTELSARTPPTRAAATFYSPRASTSGSEYEGPPNTSDSEVSTKSKSSFFGRVVGAMKKLVPKRTVEDSERPVMRLSRSQSEDNDEEYIARLEREFGRLSTSSTNSAEARMIAGEIKSAMTKEAVDIATAPDDADLHSAAEAAAIARAKALARQKRKSVRVRYEDTIEDLEGRAVGDSDESDLRGRQQTAAQTSNSTTPSDETSNKDTSGSSSGSNINKNKKQ